MAGVFVTAAAISWRDLVLIVVTCTLYLALRALQAEEISLQ